MRLPGLRLAPIVGLFLASGPLLPLLAGGALVAGCVGPLVEVVEVPQATAERLRMEIPIYQQEQLRGVRYKVLRVMEATSCKNKLWDPPASKQDATDQLRFKAAPLGTNGLLNLDCDKAGTSLGKNCWESITCEAAAIQVIR